jgi:hypothetical protein
VQDKLAANRRERALAVGAEAPSLLAGLIVDAGGNRMTPTHAQRKPSDTATKKAAPLNFDSSCRFLAAAPAKDLLVSLSSGFPFNLSSKARAFWFTASVVPDHLVGKRVAAISGEGAR